jgi:hypothetical protein
MVHCCDKGSLRVATTTALERSAVVVTPEQVAYADVRSQANSRKAELEELRNKQLFQNIRNDLNQGV